MKRPLTKEDFKKRILKEKEDLCEKWDELYEDAINGKMDRARIAFIMERLNVVDHELLNYRG